MENMTANYPGGLFLGKGAHKKKLETSAKGGGSWSCLPENAMPIKLFEPF